MRPIHLALVWHMHQPYYKDDLTGTYLLPWVRLRAAKDYYKMAELVEAYPRVKQTFNLVPSLLAQIEDYSGGAYQDLFLNLSRRPAADLSGEERQFLLRWMREDPRFLRVQSSPRYLELASRPLDARFTVEEVRDLQVWFNLAWIDPAWAGQHEVLAALKAKDRDFTEEEKHRVLDAQLELVARVIPEYAKLAGSGQAELTFSPYYHPILPLICHVDAARTALPQIRLPERHFSHREDAEKQIRMGMSAFERLMGSRPRGMWPSEMAVGESVASLAVQTGVEWFISDEEVLSRSLDMQFSRDGEGRVQQPELLYLPWSLDRDGGRVSVVFRDGLLSNLIGFDYHRMPALDAVGDFMTRLRRIREQQGDGRDYLVTVALDGENAWDFYAREGRDFLNVLYTELEQAEDIVCTTVAGFLDTHAERGQLHRLHTGSWIGASLDTWIGDPEHNLAWDLLAETRDFLEDYARHHPQESEQVAAAWREIMITEGSDWFWWFSRKHDSGMDAIWDNQYRLHLRNVYKLLQVRQPPALFRPIMERTTATERRQPVREFTPQGAQDPAWDLAGRYEVGSGFGALHKPSEVVERLLFGADEHALHFRIDGPQSPEQVAAGGVSFWIYLSGTPAGSAGEAMKAPLRPSAVGDLGFEPGTVIRVEPGAVTVGRLGEGRSVAHAVALVDAPSMECFSVPFDLLGKLGGEPVQFALVVARAGRDLEVVPPLGSLGIRVPRRGFSEGREVPPLKVLLAAAEIVPYVRSGGTADVVAALAKELRRQGHDARVVLPRYRAVSIDQHGLRPLVRGLRVPLGSQILECTVYEGRSGEVPAYLVDCPELFDRDGLYGFGDDDARFIYLSRAVIEMLRPVGFLPDVVHLHDWHVALVPNMLEKVYAADPELSAIGTALTIHNIAFQGQFGSGSMHLAGLENWGLIKVGVPQLDDVVNLLGRGIYFADVVTTVSESFAREIQTPEFGEGLDELLASNSHKLYGITNGIDVELFDPSRDPLIAHHFTAADLGGKALDRSALRTEMGLDADPRAPLIAFISRFYDQKGLDLVEQILPRLPRLGYQLAVLGTGDRRYEDVFRAASAENQGRVAAHIGFDPGLAQRIYAGSDMLMMPSRSEPGGLGQLIAMRYGTIPVVRATGGLADTVQDFDPYSGNGVGFTFAEYSAWDFHAALVRAAETFKHREAWGSLVRRAMAEDVSWARSAKRYLSLYEIAVTGRRERRGLAAALEGRPV